MTVLSLIRGSTVHGICVTRSDGATDRSVAVYGLSESAAQTDGQRPTPAWVWWTIAIALIFLVTLALWLTWVLLRRVASAEVSFLVCWMYTVWWKLSFWLRTRIIASIVFLLFASSVYVLIDVVLVLLRALRDPWTWRFTSAFQSGLPELPWWGDVIAVLLACLMVRHHVREWNLRKREGEIPGCMKGIVTELDRVLRQSSTARGSIPDDFLDSVMESTQEILKTGTKRSIEIAFMTLNSSDQKFETKRTWPPGMEADIDVELFLNDSAAGECYRTRRVVYVPSTRHLTVIDVEDEAYEPRGLKYKPTGQKERFNSLLCVPILTQTGPAGILNISSRKRNAFLPIDFEIVALVASLLSLFY